MATTSPDNLWTPDSGDGYALTQDLAAFADTVQDALVVRANYYTGDNSQMANQESKAPEGSMFFNTDDGKEYRLVSGSWVEAEASGGAYNYVWADATARNAQTGMVAGDRGYQTDTGIEYRYDGTSWLVVRAYVEFRKATPQSVATGVETTLDLDPSPTVVRGTFSETGGVVTMPHAGFVSVTVHGLFESGGSPSLYTLRVFKNGTANSILDVFQIASAGRIIFGSGMTRVSAGDTLQVRVSQNSGGNRTFTELNADAPALILQYVE